MTIDVLKTKTENERRADLAINESARTDLAKLTQKALAGSYVLMVKTQAVHWNVAGPLFKSVHDLTEDQYNDLFVAIDDLAERIRALGLKAPMSFNTMAAETEVQAFDEKPLIAEKMISALAADHELLSKELAAGAKAAAEIGDPATEDMFVERLRVHQKHAWMLRALIA